MKKTLILTIAITLVLSLPNVMAESPTETTGADLERVTESVAEDALQLEEWMIEPRPAEKVIGLEDWMLEPFETNEPEAALTLEDWMLEPFEAKDSEAVLALEEWMLNFS
jgi:hypothetical protein